MQGAKTSGRVPREATVSVSITLATALTGESTTSMVFRDAAEAETGAIKVAGSSAAAAAEQYQSAVRLQNMTGQVNPSGCCDLGPSLGVIDSPIGSFTLIVVQTAEEALMRSAKLQPRIYTDQSPDAPVSHA